jgi:tetratricopeptide (TPR) repeat protein
MNAIFPLAYSSILFVSLTTICFYLVGQLRMTQKVENRLVLLEKRLQTNQNLGNNFFKLGQIYLRKKTYEKAISCFRNSLTSWDFNDRIGLGSLYNTLGFTYFKLDQYEDAIYYYTQAIKLLPDYTLALTNLGVAYEKKKLYSEASSAYARVLKYDENNQTALERLSFLKTKDFLRT